MNTKDAAAVKDLFRGLRKERLKDKKAYDACCKALRNHNDRGEHYLGVCFIFQTWVDDWMDSNWRIKRVLDMAELIQYSGEQYDDVSTEAEDYILAAEAAPPELGLGIFAENPILLEKLLNLNTRGDVEKFARVRKMLGEYVAAKNKVRVTHFPEKQGLDKKYFPLNGYEESPFLAVKLHLRDKPG